MMKAFISIVSWAFAGKGAMNDLGIYLNSSGLGKSFIHGKCYKSSLCYSHHRVKSLDDEIRPQFVITKHDRSGINFHLVRALIWNQLCMIGVASVVLFSLYYFDENTVRLSFTWSSDTVNVYDAIGIPPNPLLLGLMGSIPSILMGVAIDRSDDHRFATANFSTVYTVMSLFGRRSVRSDVSEDGDVLKPMTHWTDVVFWSAIISLSTGVSEEMIFRLFLPFLIKTAFSSNSLSACLVQATIFGIGHMSTNVSCQENAIVGGFQLINGLCFGALYMLSGGDIIPCIVAHAVYDFQTFFATWWSANEQIDYANYMSKEPLSKEDLRELKKLGTEPHVINDFIKLFYLFDTDRNGKISLSEAHKCIYFLAIDGAYDIPKESDIDTLFRHCLMDRLECGVESVEDKAVNQLRFPDYLHLLLSLRMR